MLSFPLARNGGQWVECRSAAEMRAAAARSDGREHRG